MESTKQLNKFMGGPSGLEISLDPVLFRCTLEEGDGKYLMIDVGASRSSKNFHRDLDGDIQRGRETALHLISYGPGASLEAVPYLEDSEYYSKPMTYPEVHWRGNFDPIQSQRDSAVLAVPPFYLQEFILKRHVFSPKLLELAALPESVVIGKCGV
ncbi:unnamed protein product [Cyprideis torosa]|uniref:Uncharacterized protein n=1 Tax=Cyprideis torosa TaxID=163714 RepID=A0A7R8WT00_9CRUS|nr:unnamed protein product [Cyprideis torosa]CAG0905602.1 unnamed protein product [Cyprideis torosa]